MTSLDVDLVDTLQSDDGTLLPRTFAPTTGDRLLLEALPRLDRDSIGRDLVLGDTIGRGGMGLIRVADQPAIGRRVAVKQLDPRHGDDPAMSLALLREAWVTGEIEHPNVIPIHGIGVDERGTPMIVMKRVEGTAWSQLIYAGEKPLRWHLGVLIQVSSAASFAASKGIIHRDLKPDNVMIGSFGEVYVLDWGIAVSLTHDRGGRVPLAREVEGVCGTPGYMAPEMCEATGEHLGEHTDVYLLGAILHELITKQRRHAGSNVQQMLLAALESKPFSYDPHIPQDLAAIANRATERDPKLRFPTAADLRAAIEQFLERESSRELVDQAEQRLEAWAELEAGPAANTVLVQRYFGEARFALQQALREWPDNLRAQSYLDRALEWKFAHDLERDDFESASLVLEEMGTGTPVLRSQLELLRAKMERRKKELVELRALQNARDLDVGKRTRAFLVMLSAIGFGVTPPIAALYGLGYGFFYLTGGLKIAVGALLTWWAWDTLSRTAVNRQLAAAYQLMVVAEISMNVFSQALGQPLERALFTNFGPYALVTATLAITLDPWLGLSSALYVAGALVARTALDQVFWILGATHVVACLVVTYVWRPAILIQPRAEREAARAARK